METSLFWHGYALALAVSAPLGPVCLLAIRRTLAGGFRVGFAGGLGTATVHGLYGGIAVFGVPAVVEICLTQETWLRLAGSVVLCLLGLRTLRSRPPLAVGTPSVGSHAGAYASMLAITLTNPLTVLPYLAFAATLGQLPGERGFALQGLIVLGCVAGSVTWWLFVCTGIATLRTRVDLDRLAWLNRLGGAAVTAYGAIGLAQALSHLLQA